MVPLSATGLHLDPVRRSIYRFRTVSDSPAPRLGSSKTRQSYPVVQGAIPSADSGQSHLSFTIGTASCEAGALQVAKLRLGKVAPTRVRAVQLVPEHPDIDGMDGTFPAWVVNDVERIRKPVSRFTVVKRPVSGEKEKTWEIQAPDGSITCIDWTPGIPGLRLSQVVGGRKTHTVLPGESNTVRDNRISTAHAIVHRYTEELNAQMGWGTPQLDFGPSASESLF